MYSFLTDGSTNYASCVNRSTEGAANLGVHGFLIAVCLMDETRTGPQKRRRSKRSSSAGSMVPADRHVAESILRTSNALPKAPSQKKLFDVPLIISCAYVHYLVRVEYYLRLLCPRMCSPCSPDTTQAAVVRCCNGIRQMEYDYVPAALLFSMRLMSLCSIGPRMSSTNGYTGAAWASYCGSCM